MPIRCLVAAAMLVAAPVADAADVCLPPRQAEALLITVAPALIQTTATTCAGQLGANAYLRRAAPALAAKYAAGADAAWPLAREAMKTLGGAEAAPLLEGELARAMLPAMAGPMLAKEIKPADCPAIDRVLALIDPLPAANTAALLVTIIDLAQRQRSKPSGRRSFSICGNARP